MASHRADKNFAAYFPIWDVLFGTYWHPRKGEFPPTGLHSGERIESIWLLLVWPLMLDAQFEVMAPMQTSLAVLMLWL